MKTSVTSKPKPIGTLKMLILLAMTIIGVLFTNATQIDRKSETTYSNQQSIHLIRNDWKSPY